MATGGREMDADEKADYNGKLYKAIVNLFVQSMPAVQLAECNCISSLLLDEEMDKVKRRADVAGQNAAARDLLDFLKRKPNWFDAFMTALDQDHLKLRGHKTTFLEEKKKVDDKWRKDHSQPTFGATSAATSQQNSSIAQDSTDFKAPIPASGSGNGVPRSDFQVEGLHVNNFEEISLQRDAVEEGVSHRPHSAVELEAGMEAMTVNPGRNVHHSKSFPGPTHHPTDDGQAAAAAAGGEVYREARSNTYDIPDKLSPDSQYDQLPPLANRSLQIDACPMPEQESRIPEQEVGREAQPQPPNPRRPPRQRPQTRQEHPSLRVAISNNPHKDFEADFVRGELSLLPGWQGFQEEHEVIQLIRPNRRNEGTYVIWYWALAKRPTICVLLRGKVITFVVHRSASRSQSNKFYINRQQKRSSSLRELMSYHLQGGIRYKPSNENETTVWLAVPAT